MRRRCGARVLQMRGDWLATAGFDIQASVRVRI